MCLGRLQWRVPSAKFVTIAELRGYRLVFNKKSRDGSGKANVKPGTDSDKTLGVIFSLDNNDVQRLREDEAGYEERKGETVYDVGTGEPSQVSIFIAKADQTEAGRHPYACYRPTLCPGEGTGD